MYEAEESQLAANDLQQHQAAVVEMPAPPADPSIDELAEGISLKVAGDAAEDEVVAPPPDDIAALGSMVMAAAASSDTPEETAEEAKSRLEDVSRLNLPNQIIVFPKILNMLGLAFSNLVRYVVREYIETGIEPVLRKLIRSEVIENHTRCAMKPNWMMVGMTMTGFFGPLNQLILILKLLH